MMLKLSESFYIDSEMIGSIHQEIHPDCEEGPEAGIYWLTILRHKDGDVHVFDDPEEAEQVWQNWTAQPPAINASESADGAVRQADLRFRAMLAAEHKQRMEKEEDCQPTIKYPI